MAKKKSVPALLAEGNEPEDLYLYFLGSMELVMRDIPRYKIGVSNDPFKRARHISDNGGFKLHVIAYRLGTRQEERALHARYGQFKCPGAREWFSLPQRAVWDILKFFQVPNLPSDVEIEGSCLANEMHERLFWENYHERLCQFQQSYATKV